MGKKDEQFYLLLFFFLLKKIIQKYRTKFLEDDFAVSVLAHINNCAPSPRNPRFFSEKIRLPINRKLYRYDNCLINKSGLIGNKELKIFEWIN